VYALATPNVVTDPMGSVNLLAFNGNSRVTTAGSPSNGTEDTSEGTGIQSKGVVSPGNGTAVPCNSTVEARSSWKLW